jgi:PAS domain S-box-containing protein
VRNNKGNWFYYLVRGKAIEWDKDGKPLHITGTHLDITNRITTESLLRSSEKKYRSLYDNALIALFRTNLKDRKVIQANKVAAKIFGYSSIKEFIDKFDIGQAFVNQNDEEHVTQLLREKGYIEKLVIHSKRKDGSFIWNETSFLVDAEKGYVDCFAIDNTSRILAEKKLKETNEKLRNLYRYMNNVREEERKNIAREVHDNLGQKLTALNLDISWIQQSIPENCEELKYQFLPILDLINQSIITVQRISTELRPGILDDLGLINAIQWQSNEFSRRTNLNFKLNLGKEEIELEDEIKTQLFRVYQESLTNIIRHSDAKNIYVNLLFKKRKLIFEIIDDGKGISMNKINDSSSFGLIGMKERIASINGEFEISNRLRKGTKVRILVPLEEDK